MLEKKQETNPITRSDILWMENLREANGDYTIRAKTPVSSVELTVSSKEIALQIFQQLGKRLLTTIESELEELKGDMEV